MYWARGESGPVRVHLTGREAVCFVERTARARLREDELLRLGARVRELELRTLEGAPVNGLYFDSRRSLGEARTLVRSRGGRLYESDVKPSDRFLMERFITSGLRIEGSFADHPGFRAYDNPKLARAEYRPELTVVSIDIETAGLDDALYSIAGSTGSGAQVFLLRSADWRDGWLDERAAREERISVTVLPDEARLLEAFFTWLARVDPDVLIGWNVVDFDLHVLEKRCERLNLPFAIGRGRDRATLLAPSSPSGKRVARIPGRAVLDGIDTLRTATWSFEDFGLEAVSRKLLGRGKLIDEEEDRIPEIRRLYRDAPAELVRYNVEDCRLVEAVFERTGLVDFAVERSSLTGLALDRVGGSVAAFDNLYLPRLHRHGRVAPDVEERVSDDASPGGYVMDSEPGLFDNVVVLDFKSLYPSIIRTFRVDPLGLAEASGGDGDAVEGFRGARFAKDRHILPGLIEELWQARDRAKAARNDALSRSIKILMNSFYGVLGTPGCRFFDPRLAASITLRGHEIITTSRAWIQESGHRVVYGDTDSLFVLLGPGREEAECRQIGVELARSLNGRWAAAIREHHGLPSYLEIQFEKHYLKFFMPTIRGSEQGSKKRYAGLARRGGTLELQFTGLEVVRSDWTRLAREFQRELVRRVFAGEPFEDFVRGTVEELLAGRRDRDLVYRKRLRRRLEEYTKNVPPHAQAARKSSSPGRWIHYVMTIRGPEPLDNHVSPLDYQHYVDRQLAPAADALLQLRGTSVATIVDAQMRLF